MAQTGTIYSFSSGEPVFNRRDRTIREALDGDRNHKDRVPRLQDTRELITRIL